MNRLIRVLALVAVVAIGGCGTGNPPAPGTPAGERNHVILTDKEAAVYAAAFRYAITAYEVNGVIFLSIADKDPPPELLGVFRPVSRCHRANAGNRNVPGFEGESICDKVTGEPGCIVNVSIVEWLGNDRVKVRCSEHTAPLWAAGSDVYFRLKNGEWIFDGEDEDSGWVS